MLYHWRRPLVGIQAQLRMVFQLLVDLQGVNSIEVLRSSTPFRRIDELLPRTFKRVTSVLEKLIKFGPGLFCLLDCPRLRLDFPGEMVPKLLELAYLWI